MLERSLWIACRPFGKVVNSILPVHSPESVFWSMHSSYPRLKMLSPGPIVDEQCLHSYRHNDVVCIENIVCTAKSLSFSYKGRETGLGLSILHVIVLYHLPLNLANQVWRSNASRRVSKTLPSFHMSAQHSNVTCWSHLTFSSVY
nr:hypothetical protein CFP56_77178 [Quercus suber]